MDAISCDIFITYKCNLKCVHCFVPESMRFLNTIDWVENWITLKDLLNKKGVIDLRFVGGEPTTYRRFPILYHLASSNGFFISLTTNLVSLSDKLLYVMLSYPPRRIRVTVMGFSDESYQAVSGFKQFNRVFNNIERLKEHRLPVEIIFPLLYTNADELESLAMYCKTENIPLTIIYDYLPRLDGTSENLKYQVPINMVQRILKKVKRISNYRTDTRDKIVCNATNGKSFTIMANGEETNCPFYEVC